MQTITCEISDLGAICASLISEGITFNAEPYKRDCNGNTYLITITGN